MKKLWAAAAAVAAILTVPANAGAQVNVYTATGSTTSPKAGTAKKPYPIGIGFDLRVEEAQGQRPAPVKKYSVRFSGVQANPNLFPKCTASAVENHGPEACPKGSIAGTGLIEMTVGARDDPFDQSAFRCNAAVWLINRGDNRGWIYIRGTQTSTDPRTRCDINLAAPVDMQFVRRGSTTAIEWVMPDSLLHPLPTLSTAVRSWRMTLPRSTRRYKRRTRGFFEAIGGCSRGRRLFTFVFTPQSGVSQAEYAPVRCAADRRVSSRGGNPFLTG